MNSRRNGTLRSKQVVDYARLANVNRRARRRLPTGNENDENECQNTRRTTKGKRKRKQKVAQPDPPLQTGEVQCRYCKMRFAIVSGASTKHNKHHPDCSLFERDTKWDDTARLLLYAVIIFLHDCDVFVNL